NARARSISDNGRLISRRGGAFAPAPTNQSSRRRTERGCNNRRWHRREHHRVAGSWQSIFSAPTSCRLAHAAYSKATRSSPVNSDIDCCRCHRGKEPQPSKLCRECRCLHLSPCPARLAPSLATTALQSSNGHRNPTADLCFSISKIELVHR